MATSTKIDLTALIADLDVTPRKARRILRKSSVKRTGKTWTFTPAQAKAAVKALAA